jgi:hypothetical protein
MKNENRLPVWAWPWVPSGLVGAPWTLNGPYRICVVCDPGCGGEVVLLDGGIVVVGFSCAS